MLNNSTLEIVRHSDVEHGVMTIGKNIDPVLSLQITILYVRNRLGTLPVSQNNFDET